MVQLSYNFDYQKLFGRMKSMGFSQRKLAHKIGISEGSMSIKLREKPFSQNEIKNICKVLNIPDSEMVAYFFTDKVQKTEQSEVFV